MLWLLSSCTPQPEAIEYGSDMCKFCKMSIVDAQHGAELVTSKGKLYKFDAIECMIRYAHQDEKSNYAFELVNIYSSPKELVNASESYFLRRIREQLEEQTQLLIDPKAIAELEGEFSALKEGKLVLIIDEIEGLNPDLFGQFLHSIRQLYHSRLNH